MSRKMKQLSNIALGAVVLFAIGCAKEKSFAPLSNLTTTTNGGYNTYTDSNGQFTSGATAMLSSVSMANLNTAYYVAPLNAPTNIRVNVKLSEIDGKYAGSVKLAFVDNGQDNIIEFTAQDNVIPKGYSAGYTGYHHSEYNRWFTNTSGKRVFHGFFEQQYRALMIIVDQDLSSGDGNVGSEVNGEVWAKVHGRSFATQGYIPCWFITDGPYDCRTFLDSNGKVDTDSALRPNESKYYTNSNADQTYGRVNPQRGWIKIGRFSGLNRAKAFEN